MEWTQQTHNRNKTSAPAGPWRSPSGIYKQRHCVFCLSGPTLLRAKLSNVERFLNFADHDMLGNETLKHRRERATARTSHTLKWRFALVFPFCKTDSVPKYPLKMAAFISSNGGIMMMTVERRLSGDTSVLKHRSMHPCAQAWCCSWCTVGSS